MKISLNLRKILTFVTIINIAFILVLLGLPDFFGDGSLTLLVYLYSIAPLLVLLTLLSYAFGRTPIGGTNKKNSKKIIKFAAVGTVTSLILSIIFTIISANVSLDDYTHNKFAYENIGTGLMFVAYVSLFILINSQRFLYWPFWSRSDQIMADERQKFVRQRVFEKSYRYIIVIGLALIYIRQPAQYHLDQILCWSFALALVGLPSVIATWQKDS